MSINNKMIELICEECRDYKECDYRYNGDICGYVDTVSTQYTQQIVSEIVQELSKTIISDFDKNYSNLQSAFQGVQFCIETIKKMGEV